ncbi:MAG: cytochrome C oxidase subunit IV family protein [Pseudonocardiaceae bacterium]
MTAEQIPTSTTGAHATTHDHPSDWHYIKIAIVLALITGAEVIMSYTPSLGGLLVPGLIVLSIIKFAIVAMWFMHLRFDDRMFRRVFVAGICLAMFVYGGVLLTFHLPR